MILSVSFLLFSYFPTTEMYQRIMNKVYGKAIELVLRTMNWRSGAVSKNFAKPESSFLGRIVMNYAFRGNIYLEKNAVKESAIKTTDHVLEIGFGGGIGLQAACKRATEGHVYGVDISTLSHQYATELLHQELADGRLTLLLVSVMDIPLNNDTIDKVFHCNSFYFWPNIPKACTELRRVMKPGATMVTTLNMDRIQIAKQAKLLQNANTNLVAYMNCLETVGFNDVKIEYLKDSKTGAPYQCIFATVDDKIND